MPHTRQRSSELGWSNKQREWLKARDVSCRFPKWNYKLKRFRFCGGTYKLEVHHIRPCRMTREWWNWDRMKQNKPTNGIVLCRTCHWKIHPDANQAMAAYIAGNKKAFIEMAIERDKLIKRGIPYWDTQTDLLLQYISIKRTHQYASQERFPYQKRRKKRKS